MELKEKVLRRLESSRGEYLSGEQLAKDCGVSRNAVWKCVRALKEDGIQIGSVRNRGYVLLAESDALTACGIEKFLKHEFSLTVLKSTGSTNDEVKALANAGAPEWTAVLAEEQSAGRGRYRRPFDSPAGSGVYVSILLRPKFSAEESLCVTTAAAVAVAEAIDRVTGKYAQIKWVNDVYVKGRKVCGILTEASVDFENSGLNYAIVGIGINVQEPVGGFAPEIRDVAGALYSGEVPSGVRTRLAAELLNSFFGFYDHLTQRTFMEAYRQRSLLTGMEVTFTQGETIQEGLVLGVDDEARLQVKLPSGEVKLFSAGEVNIKKDFLDRLRREWE